jgi:hypothetical protein
MFLHLERKTGTSSLQIQSSVNIRIQGSYLATSGINIPLLIPSLQIHIHNLFIYQFFVIFNIKNLTRYQIDIILLPQS